MSEKFRLSDFEPLIREVVESGGEFTMKTRGTSMLPMLSDGGDSVILVKAPEKLLCGDVAFYKRANGQYVLHRVVDVRDDGYVMRGDSQIVNEYNVAHESVIAVMKAYIKDGKRIEADDSEYRKYVRTLEGKYRMKLCRVFAAQTKNKILSLVLRSRRKDNDK